MLNYLVSIILKKGQVNESQFPKYTRESERNTYTGIIRFICTNEYRPCLLVCHVHIIIIYYTMILFIFLPQAILLVIKEKTATNKYIHKITWINTGVTYERNIKNQYPIHDRRDVRNQYTSDVYLKQSKH